SGAVGCPAVGGRGRRTACRSDPHEGIRLPLHRSRDRLAVSRGGAWRRGRQRVVEASLGRVHTRPPVDELARAGGAGRIRPSLAAIARTVWAWFSRVCLRYGSGRSSSLSKRWHAANACPSSPTQYALIEYSNRSPQR